MQAGGQRFDPVNLHHGYTEYIMYRVKPKQERNLHNGYVAKITDSLWPIKHGLIAQLVRAHA